MHKCQHVMESHQLLGGGVVRRPLSGLFLWTSLGDFRPPDSLHFLLRNKLSSYATGGRAMHSIWVCESLTTEARVFITPVSAVVVSVAKVADRNVLLASPTAHVPRRTRTLCAVYNSVNVIYRVPPPQKKSNPLPNFQKIIDSSNWRMNQAL